MLMSVRQKYILSVTAIAIEYTRTLATKKFLDDASRVYMYLMCIFKANIFLPSVRSHEELALFSLNNITLIIYLIYLASAHKIFDILSVLKCWLQ